MRIDAAKDARRSQLRKQGDPAKDVAMKVDRADGFVFRNMTVAHAREHGLYIHETDGYLIDDSKFFYSGEYGTLTFASDHGLTSDCEATGHGDSGVYPGGAVDTGEQRLPGTAPRQNQAITRCDVHHNTLGYSGTMGNATHVYGNNFYDNGTGIATDSFFAGGHPGYPQDGAVFENNNIYSNNFNSYVKGSDVIPRVPIPVGTGILIAGGNANEVKGNRIWDNWRRGTMLMAVPDAASGNAGNGSTSNRNRFHDNFMGIAPSGAKMPNGVDFWWDNFPGNTGNCWFSNGNVTTDPVAPFMPSDCKNTSSGSFYPSRGPELGGCAAALEVGSQTRSGSGPGRSVRREAVQLFKTPPKPGSRGAPPVRSEGRRATSRAAREMCDLSGTTPSCDAFFRRAVSARRRAGEPARGRGAGSGGCGGGSGGPARRAARWAQRRGAPGGRLPRLEAAFPERALRGARPAQGDRRRARQEGRDAAPAEGLRHHRRPLWEVLRARFFLYEMYNRAASSTR